MPNENLPPCKLPESPIGCPLDSLLRLLMGQWTTYILWTFHTIGPQRFGELKRNVSGISAKVLTERLKMLEEAGVIYRQVQPTNPPQVTYGPTKRAFELFDALEGLNTVARSWMGIEAEPLEKSCV